MGAQRDARDDTQAAAATALDRPEQLRVGASIRDAHLAVGGDHLGFEQAGRRCAEVLRKRAEAAALHQAGDADRRAAAALDVAAAARGDSGVGIAPHGARAERDRRLRRRAGAAVRDERIMHGHRIHRARPHQQRIGRVRRAEVAVPSSLDHQPQVVAACKVYGSGDIGRAAGRHGVGAGARSPGIHPAAGLRQGRLVADKVGIADLPEHFAAARAAACERRFKLEQAPAGRAPQVLPLRRRRPERGAGTHARPRHAAGRRASWHGDQQRKGK